MGHLRKVKKKLPEPMILFVPNEHDTYVKFLSEQPDIITVTDRDIYEKVKKAVMQSLKQGKHGVIWKP